MPTDAFDVRFRVKSRRWIKDGVMPLADLTLSAAMLSRIDARLSLPRAGADYDKR
jgi:hypothetical protein